MNIPNTTITMKNTKRLRSGAKALEPILRIGKSGVTESQIKEIDKLLKKQKLIKMKILKTVVRDKDKIINEVLKNTNSILIEKIGNVIVLYKEKNKNK